MSEQLPPTEHWRGHLNVPRPPGGRRSPRGVVRSVLLAMFIGLVVLGLLELMAPGWGVMLVAGGSLLLAAGLASPLPISFDFIRHARFGAQHPDPLLTPALLVLAFGVPAIVVAVIGVLAG